MSLLLLLRRTKSDVYTHPPPSSIILSSVPSLSYDPAPPTQFHSGVVFFPLAIPHNSPRSPCCTPSMIILATPPCGFLSHRCVCVDTLASLPMLLLSSLPLQSAPVDIRVPLLISLTPCRSPRCGLRRLLMHVDGLVLPGISGSRRRAMRPGQVSNLVKHQNFLSITCVSGDCLKFFKN